MRLIALVAALPFAAFAATRLQSSQLPTSEWPDMEASTNLVFDAGLPIENKFVLTIELDAAVSNNVEVAFGVDADEDGDLDFDEGEFAVGWDCGAWFYRDLRTGASGRAMFEDGRRKLEWTIYLNNGSRTARQLEATDDGVAIPFAVAPTFFNPAWNVARVTVRGKTATQECVAANVSSVGFALSIR